MKEADRIIQVLNPGDFLPGFSNLKYAPFVAIPEKELKARHFETAVMAGNQ
jgi:hypothetical protein